MSILWNFDKYAKIEELPFDPASINSDSLFQISDVELLLKAGTPLVESSGVVAPLGEDDDPTCFANEDYHFILTNPQQPKMIKCVTKGYVEQAKVLAAAGLESVPDGWADALAALGLFLVDDLGNLPGGSGGGSSGGGILTVTGTYGETAYLGAPGYTLDKTYAEIHAALEAKTPVFVWQNESAGEGPGMICLLATESYYYNEAYFIDAGNPGAGGSSKKRIQYVAPSESDYPVGAYGAA